ncbi:Nsp1_C domain-containing protein, partial [Haematococcus lacustris]
MQVGRWALAAWDRGILTNRHELLKAEASLKAVVAGQDALERKLNLLEAHQKEVHDALASIENEAERLLLPELSLLDGDATERDRLYARAEAVSSLLQSLGSELHDTVADTNQLGTATLSNTRNTPMATIVQILNNQLQATRPSDCSQAWTHQASSQDEQEWETVSTQMLIIVRHGESEYNKAVLESKHYSDPLIFDPRLTHKGLAQCKELQQKLATILADKRQEFGEPLWV